jgi:DUF971 family protein
MYPVSIKVKQKQDIYIKWNDGSSSEINLRKLREFCPCATCITLRRNQSRDYIPIFSQNQLIIANINQIGSYAVQVIWNDGHNAGIYEFPFLKNLGLKN